jgi:mRNA interferase HigB
MKLLNRGALQAFASKHRSAKSRLDNWGTAVRNANWGKFADVRQTAGSADVVGPNVVFNVGSDRIVATIDYVRQSVRIKRVLTHAEYERLNIAEL